MAGAGSQRAPGLLSVVLGSGAAAVPVPWPGDPLRFPGKSGEAGGLGRARCSVGALRFPLRPPLQKADKACKS